MCVWKWLYKKKVDLKACQATGTTGFRIEPNTTGICYPDTGCVCRTDSPIALHICKIKSGKSANQSHIGKVTILSGFFLLFIKCNVSYS